MAVTLAEILAREVPLHWYETVAVGQQVCARLRGLAVGSDLPELQHIELLPEGDVALTGVRHTRDTPVARVGFIMHAMLGEDVPVQLRLLISKATLPVPLYGSVDEFSKALEYFERPSRTNHLTELYQRYLAAPPNIAPQPVVLLTSQDVAGQQQQQPNEAARSRRPIVAAGAAAVVAVGVVALLVSRSNNQITDVKTVASEAVATTFAGVVNMIGRGADTLWDRLGTEVPAMTATPAGEVVPPIPPPAPVPAAPRRSAPARATSAPRAASIPAPSIAPPPPVVASPSPTVAPPRPAPTMPTIAPVPSSARLAAGGARRTAGGASRVFTLEDADVAPPLLEGEMLPTRLPANLRTEDLAVMELIIGPEGTVERVQLQKEPRNVLDSMMLQVAKAWHFQPATLNGEAVSYRKLIWIAKE